MSKFIHASTVKEGQWIHGITYRAGRNAAKREDRARIFKGPAKTPKGTRPA